MTEQRRRAPGARHKGLAAAGLLLVLVAAGPFALVPGQLAENRAYAAAPTCQAAPRSASCTTTVPATVRGRESGGGRSLRGFILLTERGSKTVQRVRMSGTWPLSGTWPHQVYDSVRAGDAVELTYWRGEIRTVRFGPLTQETSASPADDWRVPLGIGLGLLPFGLSLAWMGWWYLYRSLNVTTPYPWQVMAGLIAGALLGCFGSAATLTVVGEVREAVAVSAVGIVPIAVLAGLYGWAWRRRMLRAADTRGIVPLPPTEKQCVPAGVLGDVPYSVAGFTHLVVGDGPPATTPDPEGRVARRELPATLTVQHVRGLRADDPEHWPSAYQHDAVVIECRDDDHAVLIVTRRRDSALTLGALNATVWTSETAHL